MKTRCLLFVVLVACSGGDPEDTSAPAPADSFVVVTYNTGTSEGMAHDEPPDDGYDSTHAATSDEWYGDGLSWLPAVDAATAFFADLQPDVVVFQEIFYAGLCADIPADQHDDFFCETWKAGDPTVAQAILGDDYQVACHPGKDDKCAAVHTDFGTFTGCDDPFCLEGLDGEGVDDCGSGARIARGVIERTDGSTLTLVNVHGSSGLSGDDQDCRVKQVDQVFEDLDGEPAANGELNLIMGDLNTDPGRLSETDPSAARWLDFVPLDGSGDFWFVTPVGPDVPATYSGFVSIDHVVSDAFDGDCEAVGLDDDPVIDAVYFDHLPIVCTVEAR